MIFDWASRVTENLLQMRLDSERAVQAEPSIAVDSTKPANSFSMSGLFELIPQNDPSPRSLRLFPRRN
jgi:hypothetical protein